jgi:hypothetical protein
VKDLSLHILDIAENSIEAGARNIDIIINEDLKSDLLTLEINDDGKGMDAEYVKKITDPFVTTRTKRRVGFGISLLKDAAESANGKLIINSVKGKGTMVKATFQMSHIDRKPLGNLKETLRILIISNPGINIKYVHKKDNKVCTLDSKLLKDKLSGKEFSTFEFMKYLDQMLSEII